MYKLCIYVTIAFALAGVTMGHNIQNVKCTGRREANTLSVVDSIQVTPCVDADGLPANPCRFERGNNSTATVTVQFTPQMKHKRMKATLSWRNGAIDLPFRGMQSNACRSLTSGRCPTTPGQTHIWTAAVPIQASFPANNYPLKLKIMDGSKYIVCQFFSIRLI